MLEERHQPEFQGYGQSADLILVRDRALDPLDQTEGETFPDGGGGIVGTARRDHPRNPGIILSDFLLLCPTQSVSGWSFSLDERGRRSSVGTRGAMETS